jgi:hypothetical protein rflaF_05699
MKKERKEHLLHSFPSLPDNFFEQMKGRGAQNFVVMLTNGNELFARCYHRYSKGEIVERQRYVFAKDGAVRYGKDDGKSWTVRSEFREPVFCQSGYGYTFDNSYCIINHEAIRNSCMKYAVVSSHTSLLYMEYLRLFCRHPNAEYLMKTGYDFLIGEEYSGFWGNRLSLSVSPYINWKSNNLLKMLGLNRNEFKALQGRESIYPCYMMWRNIYTNYRTEELLMIAETFRHEEGTAERLTKDTGLKLRRLARYLSENKVVCRDYSDYIDQCRKLKYDLHDTAISMPHDFTAMHTRLSNVIKYGNSEGLAAIFRQNMESRRILEYAENGLIIRQPQSYEEIVEEGKILNHCVGGYAERHALGKLTILFLRTTDKPDVPYYTMEVSNDGRIIQVRGLRNCPMTDEVNNFVEEYKQHLSKIFSKKARVSA